MIAIMILVLYNIGTAPNIELAVVSEELKSDHIVLTLEWISENGMSAFSELNVVPQAEIISLGPSSRQLVISYNTSYNASAVASLCGQQSLHSIELHYGELLHS